MKISKDWVKYINILISIGLMLVIVLNLINFNKTKKLNQQYETYIEVIEEDVQLYKEFTNQYKDLLQQYSEDVEKINNFVQKIESIENKVK